VGLSRERGLLFGAKVVPKRGKGGSWGKERDVSSDQKKTRTQFAAAQ